MGNFFSTKEITRHSGIKTWTPGIYIDEKTGNPAKTCVQSCRRERNLRTQNCRCKFTENLLPEKLKSNKQTKQPRFKLRLKWPYNNVIHQMYQ